MTHTTAKCIRTAYENHRRSNLVSLWDCYCNPSEHKQNALTYCYYLMAKYNGTNGRIIGYNSQVFSFGFIGEMDGRKAFFYITRDYDRYIYIDELGG